MTCEQDIVHAIALGVDAIGLIFYAKSRRAVSLEQAKKLLEKMPVFVDVVAVFVNPDSEWVETILNELPVQWLQFHGEESPEFCAQFKKPYIKAIQASSMNTIELLSAQHHQAAAILLDTPSAHHGGTGMLFDWSVVPQNLSQPLIIAGGLNPHNVHELVAHHLPYAVDVCSGVEAEFGIKDHEKMNQFVHAVWGKE